MWAPWDEYGKRHALHMATALTWTLPLHEHHVSCMDGAVTNPLQSSLSFIADPVPLQVE